MFSRQRSHEELVSTLSKRRLTNNKKEMGTQMAKWSKYMNRKKKYEKEKENLNGW